MSIKKKSTTRNALQFSRDKERHKQTFFKCIRHEKRLKKNSVHLLVGEGKLIDDDTEMTEVLNLFFFLSICQKVNCLKARQSNIWRSKLNQNKWEKRKKLTEGCRIYWINHWIMYSSRSKIIYPFLQPMPRRMPDLSIGGAKIQLRNTDSI